MSSLEAGSSTGSLGADFSRTEGRAYNNVPDKICNYSELVRQYREFHMEAERRGRRRTVFRTRCTQEVYQNLIGEKRLPLEVAIPLNLVDSHESDYLIMIGENTHASEISEWSNVYEYWKIPLQNPMTPLQRVQNLSEQYNPTVNLSTKDEENLFHLWKPFGCWRREDIQSFIARQNSDVKNWFAGIRDAKGELVSACTAEQLPIAGITLIETTEYRTFKEHERRGLCSTALSLLIAQIIQDTVHNQGKFPLIVAEFNMSSRSDIAGRQVGMSIPLVEEVEGLEQTPSQVLRRNVSVLDGMTPNTLSWREQTNRQHYREAYKGNPFRYWRNFIYGILPKTTIDQHYNPYQVEEILALAK